MSWPLRILSGAAALLVVVLGVGFLLPGTWATERSRVLPADAEPIWSWLVRPEAWSAWTPWPEGGLEPFGPREGEGAGLRWDDPGYGDGAFTLTHAAPFREIRYEVRVQEGSMVTRGRLTLEPSRGGTRVTWREEGDFGWNPLLGYAALGMERMQGEELEKSLDRLRGLVAGEAVPSPTPVR